ncbi:Hypothetical Protein MfeM64YM_0694 [Mycoplasmopsis fermentans M64]|uniref:Uncharacterized protein n=1 Tax=Mycoplasmopsis fermentans (strain M64) TaxID=943945 RepID=A0AB32XCD5_MYCFM|nr:Hypothetical Protein MfeM64YM_0694 [Mycoplasmopsis fermentans M64]
MNKNIDMSLNNLGTCFFLMFQIVDFKMGHNLILMSLKLKEMFNN